MKVFNQWSNCILLMKRSPAEGDQRWEEVADGNLFFPTKSLERCLLLTEEV